MLRTIKANFRRLFIHALFVLSVLSFCCPTAFAVNTTHPPVKKTHKKHHPAKPKRHHVKKKSHRAQHAQLRHPVMETPETSQLSPGEPLNHDLAAVNSTHFFSNFPGNWMRSVKKDMVDFVEKTVDNLHYSSYKLGGKRFDPEKGVYILDCSNFVDNVLQNVYPNAYSNLVNSVGADNPASEHYFNFFRELADESDSHWNKINDVEKLQPGDILVFRYKNSRGVETGGHVMVVMDKPERVSDVYFVRVADSAPSRHSEDTRQVHESGIGIGTLLLRANPKTGKPSAFAWGVNGYWNKNVKFAMARPIEV